MKDSFFMKDSSESDYGKEAMLDFQLSWLMRIAANKDYENEKPKLFAIAKDTLLRLIGIEDSTGVEIKSVEVWKQWDYIDLVANVIISINGKDEKHVVAFEDKAYTQLRDGQLDKCKNNVEDWYSHNEDWKDAEKHYCVVSALDKPKALAIMKECEQKGFEYFDFYDIIGYKKEEDADKFETESDLFNEFWARYWS